jgi:hypothetical protein
MLAVESALIYYLTVPTCRTLLLDIILVTVLPCPDPANADGDIVAASVNATTNVAAVSTATTATVVDVLLIPVSEDRMSYLYIYLF